MKQSAIDEIKKGPGHTLHDKLLNLVRDRFNLSWNVMSQRHDAWREVDRHVRVFVDLTKKDADGKKLNPWARSIVWPDALAILETIQTVVFAMFSSRRPIWPIEGRGPEDVGPAQRLQVVGDYQWDKTAGMLGVHQWFYSAGKYGLGVVKNVWDTREIYRTIRKKKSIDEILGFPASALLKIAPQSVLTKESGWMTEYEGNVIVPIDPTQFFPDVRVPLGRFDEGEFIGYKIERFMHYLRQKEHEEVYFNIKFVDERKTDSSIIGMGTSGIDPSMYSGRADRDEALGISSQIMGENLISAGEKRSTGAVELAELWIQLIPDDWDLDDSEAPEIYRITVANGAVIIACDAFEGRAFPFHVIQPNYDLFATLNPGHYDQLQSLQELASWLVNSRMENVRRVLNDSLIVDPTMIEIEDIINGGPGKIIRLLPEWQGVQGAVNQAVNQLKIQDVTGSHLADLKLVDQMMQIVSGATHEVMGVLELSGRRTATEHSGNLQQATSRLKRIAELYSLQGMTPLVRSQVENTQEFMSEAQWFKLSGDYPDLQADAGRIFISPEDVQGEFDYPVNINSPALDPVGYAQTCVEMLKAVGENQLLGATFDPVPIFKEWLRARGIKNIDAFIRKGPPPGMEQGIPGMGPMQPQVMPSDQIQKQVQAGNMAPMEEVMGGRR